MFDFLKGGQANVQVTLDRPNQIYGAGDTVHVTVNVQGVKDLKIQNAQIALVSREEYVRRYDERSTDSNGNSTIEENTRRETDERKVWQQQFLGETTIKGNSNQAFEFNVPIPPDALPTVDGGKILSFAWRVKTTLDRRLRGDVEDIQELYVIAKPYGNMGGAGEYGTSNEPGEARLSLRLSNTGAAVGETIAGELLIQPQKAFDATEIRVELERTEDVPQDKGNQQKEKQTVKMAGSTHLDPGQNLNMPFQIKIPSGAPFTCRTRHGSISWVLRGVLARRMRGDTSVEQEILLFSGK
ncbi:MAG: sporulation protein [Chloroflexi bacterium]|nr:sporulation protein [Chloroflexota bacterium]